MRFEVVVPPDKIGSPLLLGESFARAVLRPALDAMADAIERFLEGW